MTSESTVREALRTIVDNRHAKSLNYAINYAQAGITMTGEELRVQCLYVLNNMSHWRGEVAKAVRMTLKTFTK